MKIKGGKVVHFKAEDINRVYSLSDFDQPLFTTKDYALGIWLVSKLCLGKNVPRETTKEGIISNEFMAKANIWLSIICSRVSPCGNMTNILIMKAQMISYILNNISLNVGVFVISEFYMYKV